MAKLFHHISVLLLAISGVVTVSRANYVLTINNRDFDIKQEDKANFSLILNEEANDSLIIKLSCAQTWDSFDSIKEDCKGILGGIAPIYTIPNRSVELNVTVVGAKPGKVTLIAHVNESSVDTSKAFVRINVGYSALIDSFSKYVGWTYLIAWIISFCPQIRDNYKTKSVKGLNFDYVGLNITGFLCYTFFNCSLYLSPYIQSEYEIKFPRSQIPVAINDVVFSILAVLLTFVIIWQCYVYEKREGQMVSLYAIGFLVMVWSSSAIIAIIVLSTNEWITWLSLLYFFSYIKLVITLIKYIPQAYYNYQRKSTKGWSIGNIILDCTGGGFSIAQMFLLAYNYDDWRTLFTNFTKFFLGAISIIFDVIFLLQHYKWFRNADDYEQQSAQLSASTSHSGNDPLIHNSAERIH